MNIRRIRVHLSAVFNRIFSFDIFIRLIFYLKNLFTGKSSVAKISLLFAGDLMSDIIQIKYAKNGDIYNYSDCYKHVKNEINSVDIAVANLEVTHGGEPYSGYYVNSTPEEFTHAAVDAGFDILFTANNHTLDKGKIGLERTINLLDERNVAHTGTFINKDSRDKFYPLVFEKNGVRVVFLNYTYGTNNFVAEVPNIVNYIDRTQIAVDIENAKLHKPDCIIAFMHWGSEYEYLPNKFQKELAQWMISQGVDHIIGSHTHCIQPIEMRYDLKTNKKHLIVYSLGNFLSNPKFEKGRVGSIIKFNLIKYKNRVDITNPEYALTWTSSPVYSKKKNFEIYPASFLKNNLTLSEREFMSKYISKARFIFALHNKGVKEYKF